MGTYLFQWLWPLLHDFPPTESQLDKQDSQKTAPAKRQQRSEGFSGVGDQARTFSRTAGRSPTFSRDQAPFFSGMRKIPALLFISPIENGVLASAALNTPFNQLRSQNDHSNSSFKIDRRWRGKGRSKAVQTRMFTGVGTFRTRIYLP